jgi:hypothetical protein
MCRALPVLLVALVIHGCALPRKPEPYTESYDIWLGRSVDVADGINKDEASVIAYAFYASGVSDCGSPLAPQWVEGDWVSNTLAGPGRTGKPIYVDAGTGDVSGGDVSMSLTELKGFRRGD